MGVAWRDGRSWASGVLSSCPGLAEDLQRVVRTVGTSVCSGRGKAQERLRAWLRGADPLVERQTLTYLPVTHVARQCNGAKACGRSWRGREGSRGWVSWGGGRRR